VRKKILVADDEEFIRRLVSATLRDDRRFDVLLAADGVEALELAQKEKPDIIFLDVLMPKLDGFEVCRRLKSDPQTSAIRIIMLTALDSRADREKGEEVGADGYFTKPFSPTALIQEVEERLAEE